MDADTLLLHFAEDQAQADRLAQATGFAVAQVVRHRFPDGELKLRLPPQLPDRVVVLRSLDHPNEKLVELLLVARTARTLGATHLTLVAPYLAYMRQDIAFERGEVVSQRVVGRFLADLFNTVITRTTAHHSNAHAHGHFDIVGALRFWNYHHTGTKFIDDLGGRFVFIAHAASRAMPSSSIPMAINSVLV